MNWKTLFATIGLFACMSIGVYAQNFEGRTISNVVIRYKGAKTVDSTRIRNFMSVRAGQKFNSDVIDEDIKNLYESGLVEDVRFLAESAGSSVIVIAEVKTRGGLAGVGFSGNTVFSDNKLAKETKLEVGGSLSDAEILAARRKIETLYQAYGYPDVGVSHSFRPTERAGFSDLIFSIQEGVRNEVRKIRFQGNQSFADVELKREMKTKQKGIFSFLTKSGKIDSVVLEQDMERILEFYRNNGFLRASISGVQRVAVRDGRVDLVIPVYEGPKYRVNSVAFGPMSVFTPAELAPGLSLIAGDVYSEDKMKEDIKTIRSYYGSRGYADAKVSEEIRDHRADSVNIIYRVTEGNRVLVGRVNIQGNNVTKDRVIRREVPMKPGDNFNTVDMEATRRRLKSLNYFNKVEVNGVPSNRQGYRDLNINLDEKKTGQISFGAGFSSVDNIVGYINVEQTNFDITNPFRFSGGGQRFRSSLRFGSERRDFSLSLTEPWFLGKKMSLTTELYYQDRYFLSDEYDQTNIGGAVSLKVPIAERTAARLEYRYEKIEVDADSDASAAFQAEDGDFYRSALTLGVEYDSRDSNILPRRGLRLGSSVSYAGDFLGGDVDVLKFSLSGAKHWSLPYDMIFNLEGAANTVDAIDGEVPIFDRVFLGGQRDLRGFDFRNIGKNSMAGYRDADSKESLGGQSSAYLTAEMTFPIIENVRGALFGDAGFVNEDTWDFSSTDLYGDVGLGLRLNLPLGPLAIDYAFPVVTPDDDEVADEGAQFQFYLDYQF